MKEYSDILAYLGAPCQVKNIGNGQVEVSGLAVVFDSEEGGGADLTGEFFSAKSFLSPTLARGEQDEFEATFNHGFASRKELQPLAEHEFRHPVKATVTDTGVMASLILEEADEYEAMIAQVAREGKMRWSSGSAPHRVKRTEVKDGRVWLRRWPIVEIALTHTPAEPRTRAGLSVKSLFEPVEDPTLSALKATNEALSTITMLRAIRSAAVPAD